MAQTMVSGRKGGGGALTMHLCIEINTVIIIIIVVCLVCVLNFQWFVNF
jgi:hypothetical protein